MENELFDLLRNMTVGEFVQLILKHEQVNSSGSKSEDVYYTAKELIQKYPNMFSKYKLDKYIKNENFPVVKEGKERFFIKSEVEKWLENKRLQAIFKNYNQ